MLPPPEQTKQNAAPARGRVVYRGPRFEVHAASLPGARGQTVQRDAVVSQDAAVILPLLDAATVVLIRNERFVVGHTLWELPAGTVEAGEDPRVCAARELAEEAGYEAGRLTALTRFYPSPGLCTECMHAYLAEQLRHVGQSLDANERIVAQARPLDEAMKMIERGEICDGKTIAALLYYAVFVRDGTQGAGTKSVRP